MRVVLDANVLVSAVISSRGSPAHILSAWEQERIALVVSEPILDELHRVMRYPHLRERYYLPEALVDRFLRLLRGSAILVEPTETVDAISADPSDNRYLEAAVAGGARYLVSGDRHLLDLNVFRGIQIVSPGEFLAFLELEGRGFGE